MHLLQKLLVTLILPVSLNQRARLSCNPQRELFERNNHQSYISMCRLFFCRQEAYITNSTEIHKDLRKLTVILFVSQRWAVLSTCLQHDMYPKQQQQQHSLTKEVGPYCFIFYLVLVSIEFNARLFACDTEWKRRHLYR